MTVKYCQNAPNLPYGLFFTAYHRLPFAVIPTAGRGVMTRPDALSKGEAEPARAKNRINT